VRLVVRDIEPLELRIGEELALVLPPLPYLLRPTGVAAAFSAAVSSTCRAVSGRTGSTGR
jgi:hypothetical protein